MHGRNEGLASRSLWQAKGGETYLIEEYYSHDFAFKLTGAYRQPKKFQLESFSDELARRAGVDQHAPRDWREAFRLLRNYLESLPTGEKKVVFFDEMPWLDTPKSDFLPVFEWF